MWELLLNVIIRINEQAIFFILKAAINSLVSEVHCNCVESNIKIIQTQNSTNDRENDMNVASPLDQFQITSFALLIFLHEGSLITMCFKATSIQLMLTWLIDYNYISFKVL